MRTHPLATPMPPAADHRLGQPSPRWRWPGLPLVLLLCSTVLWLSGCATRARVAPTTVPPQRVAAMVQVAEAEWQRWGRQWVQVAAGGESCAVFPLGYCQPVEDGCGKEQTAALCPVVNTYWQALAPGGNATARHRCGRTDVCEAEWPSGAGEPERTPAWSAAFISAVLRQAGFSETEFRFGAAHAEYVVAARDGYASAFQVVPTPTTVAVGDLVCAPRLRSEEARRSLTVQDIRDRDGVTPMHCDLVVAVDPQARRIEVIGGNVQQAVSRSAIALDEQLRLVPTLDADRYWLLVMRLRRGP